MPSRWKTSGLSGSRRARRRARAPAIGCEMGRIRPIKVFERAGESRMTPPASSISSQVRPRISFLRQPEAVGEVEDVLPRGGQVGADGEVFGVLEEALAGGILPQAVGEAGHGVEPTPVDGEGAHAVEGRGLAIDGAGGRPQVRRDAAAIGSVRISSPARCDDLRRSPGSLTSMKRCSPFTMSHKSGAAAPQQRPTNAAICPWRLALLCLLAPGPSRAGGLRTQAPLLSNGSPLAVGFPSNASPYQLARLRRT